MLLQAYGEHEGEIIAAQKNQTGMQCLHRARFLDELVKLIPAQRAHFGKRLTKIEHKTEDEGCVLYFKDGTTAIADAIIGADGIHSAVRLYLLGETHPASKPVFTGTATYRGIVSMDRAIEKLGAELAQNSIMLCGPGAAILSYPIEHGAELNIVLMDFEVGEKWEHEKWIVPAKFEDLARLIDGWGRSAQNMIEVRRPLLCDAQSMLTCLTASRFAGFSCVGTVGSPPGALLQQGSGSHDGRRCACHNAISGPGRRPCH